MTICDAFHEKMLLFTRKMEFHVTIQGSLGIVTFIAFYETKLFFLKKKCSFMLHSGFIFTANNSHLSNFIAFYEKLLLTRNKCYFMF